MCDGSPKFKGSGLIAQAVVAERAKLAVTDQVKLGAVSQVIDFGPTNLNLTFGRWGNCTTGGYLDICAVCAFLNCEDDLKVKPLVVVYQLKFHSSTRAGSKQRQNSLPCLSESEILFPSLPQCQVSRCSILAGG